MDPYKDFLRQTLNIINYPQDKEAWINQFLEGAQQQAFLNLLQTLPQDQQQQLTSQLEHPPFGQTPEQTLQKYFSPLECSIALQEQILEEFKKFVQNTMPSLTPDKQKELQDFLLPLVNSAK